MKHRGLDRTLSTVCRFEISINFLPSPFQIHSNANIIHVTHLFWTQLMSAALEVATYQRKCHNVTILSRKL